MKRTRAIIERYEHAADECTIFASQTEWISAEEGGYVRLDVAR